MDEAIVLVRVQLAEVERHSRVYCAIGHRDRLSRCSQDSLAFSTAFASAHGGRTMTWGKHDRDRGENRHSQDLVRVSPRTA